MAGGFSTQRSSKNRSKFQQAMDWTCPGLLSYICLQTSLNWKLISRRITKMLLPPPLALMSQVPPTVMKCFSSQISDSPAILLTSVEPCQVIPAICMVVGTSIIFLVSADRWWVNQTLVWAVRTGVLATAVLQPKMRLLCLHGKSSLALISLLYLVLLCLSSHTVPNHGHGRLFLVITWWLFYCLAFCLIWWMVTGDIIEHV